MVRDGYYYALALLLIAAAIVFFATGSVFAVPLAAVPVLLAAFFLWFFRDPERLIPQGAGLVVSPADGKVTQVAWIHTPEGSSQRISIFLNVFNVHVNRSPVAGVLSEVAYKKGQYLNAMDPASAEHNEQNTAYLVCEHGEIAFKQIAGLLARRIVFNYKPGDRLERGQRVGLIKFGSRCDVVLPAQARLRVQVGEIVKGGSSILADFPVTDDGTSIAPPITPPTPPRGRQSA